MKRFIVLLAIVSFSLATCNGMEYLAVIQKMVNNSTKNAKSVYNEFNVRTSLGIDRKEEVHLNLSGSGVTFLASSCATSYGLSNLFNKNSSKLAALISITAGLAGMMYSGYGIYVHSQSYKPYID
jgi:hypothetical protein